MSALRYGLEDKVVLVTGGSRGIGLAVSRELLEQGAKLAICARKREGLEEAVKALGAPGRVLAVNAHIAREDDVERLFREVTDRFSRLDVLVKPTLA
jgi:2-deoxy-D-gluconate 3-dehydrogenase